MTKFNPNLPITAQNCPTREALERTPKLTQSISAKHTAAKAERHRANVQARANGGKKS